MGRKGGLFRPFLFMNQDPYQRAVEAYETARQMALDLNQHPASRREWERKRDLAAGIIHELFDWSELGRGT